MADIVTTPRALTATVIAVCGAERFADTSSALASVRERSGVRSILISLGATPQPPVETDGGNITIRDIVPRYLNNAVAALRLSSLPSIAWWRGGDSSLLPDLAALVDCLILDAEDPRESWKLVPQLARSTQVGDLRWTALTRSRSLVAQFFDIPAVQASIGSYSKVRIVAGDVHTGRLLAGWLSARLPEGGTLGTEVSTAKGPVRVQSVAVIGSRYRLSLELLPTTRCIRTSIQETGGTEISRIVPVGDQSNEALIAEELRVRARDRAFEQAVLHSAELS
jgi:glucose-6-phosphate dehydrogenase assembly protein OpcA